jgi:hypothetical protein
MEAKYIPNGVVFKFVDMFDSRTTVKAMLDDSDFRNELVIDYGVAQRRALTPKTDTRHVVTYSKNARGSWDIITHPHGRSCGSVRYTGASSEREAQDYVRGYMNRRFRRLNKFV